MSDIFSILSPLEKAKFDELSQHIKVIFPDEENDVAYSIEVTPTGIGSVITAIFRVTGIEKELRYNITDYDCW